MTSGLPTPTELKNSGIKRIVRIGVIGAGRMGMTHISILGGNPQAEVVAIAEDSALMKRVLTKFRPDIQLFDSSDELLQRVPLDGIVIATPPDLHAPMIQAGLENNLSIFVEKPFVLDGTDARRLSAAAASKMTTHQVGYVNRFNDMFCKAKEIVQSGILGRLVSFRSDMFGRTVTQASDGSGWRAKRTAGGGCLYEFGSHAIDLMVFLFGKPSKVIGTQLVRVFSAEVEDMVRTNVQYENGITGSITVNWSDPSYRKPSNKIEIIGENGKLLVDQHELKLFLNRASEGYIAGWSSIYITDIFSPVPFYVRGSEFTKQLFHFVDMMQNPGTSNRASFADATATQEVIDMMIADSGGIR